MYKTPVVVSSENHARLRFVPADDFQFAATQTQAPLMGGEVVQAAEYYPVVFNQSTGEPLAVLGLTANRNLYLDSNYYWRAPFVPASCTNYPFALAKTTDETGSQHYVLTMDTSAETLQDKKGKLLFNKNGNNGYRPSPLLKTLKQKLAGVEINLEKTRVLFSQLVTHDVLIAQQADFPLGERQGRLEGFAVVDWEKVQQLDETVIAQWKTSGLLSVLEAHTRSLKHFNLLGRLLNQS